MKRFACFGIFLTLISTSAWQAGLTEPVPPENPAPQAATPVTENEQTDAQTARDQRAIPAKVNQTDAIQQVCDAGWMSKDAQGQFHAERPISRAELAVALDKAFRLNTRQSVLSNVPPLKDVPATHWAASAIQDVNRLGIMQGYRDELFYPNHTVSRAEGISIIAQAYGVQQYDPQTLHVILSVYPDAAQLPDWSRKAMATALKQGFVNLTPDNTIRPMQVMTRGDLAFSLAQYLYRLNKVEQPQL